MMLMVALPACHKEKHQISSDIVSENESSPQNTNKPSDKKLLLDSADVIDDVKAKEIEESLQSFLQHTGNKILVVTVKSIGNYNIAEYGLEFLHNWSVEQSDTLSAVVLIKVKTENEDGKVFIVPGYGVEGALPDMLNKHIIEKDMIPRFKENDYAGGIKAGLKNIMNSLEEHHEFLRKEKTNSVSNRISYEE